GAQERPATLDTFLLARFGGIKRAVRSSRVARDGSGAHELRVVVRAVPIAHPFPGIAGDVVETVARRRERSDRSEPRVAVLAGVLHGELSLIRVGHGFASGVELVAPGVELSRESTARGELPLCLGGKPLAD